MGCAYRMADGGYLIGEPVAPAVAELAATGSGRGAVQGIELNAHRSSEARPTGEPCGVGQVGMENVRLVGSQPTMEAQPAAGIGEALAHGEALEADSVAGQFGGGGASGAGEGNDADAPSAAAEALGE